MWNCCIPEEAKMPENLTIKIPVIVEGIVWLGILGEIKLALRHPHNLGPSAELSRKFADQLRNKLHEEGVLSDDEFARSLRDDMRFPGRTVAGPKTTFDDAPSPEAGK
jgi:hypothetical protein